MDPVLAVTALGSIALIVGLCVALVQLRVLNKQRHDEVVMRLYAPLHGLDLTQAYWHVIIP
jgi:hypothetical protein